MSDRYYHFVEEIAQDPPGGIPEGWEFIGLRTEATYDPENGEWWKAKAEYQRSNSATGTRRLIGAGFDLLEALMALRARLYDPLTERLDESRGGWDTNHEPGRTEW